MFFTTRLSILPIPDELAGGFLISSTFDLHAVSVHATVTISLNDQSHFKLRVVSEKFEGLPLVKRHQ